MIECTEHQAALIFPHSREFLALLVSRKVEFPIVRLFHWGHTTANLTSHIQERWKVRTIVLEAIAGKAFRTSFAIIEVRMTY